MTPHTRAQLSIVSSIMEVVEEKGAVEDYTQDATVNLQGRPVLRSNTGRWKACSFIVGKILKPPFAALTACMHSESYSSFNSLYCFHHVQYNELLSLMSMAYVCMCKFIGYEVFERMAYFGIASNLVVYLTNKLHEGTVESSANISNWAGSVWMMPLAGAYIADAYLGRYWTFVIASCIYLLGMCLLTLAVSLSSLRPPQCAQGIEDQNCPQSSPLQKGIFFLALYIIAVGIGGTKPNISTMGADQFDDLEAKEKSHKLSFFNWWFFSILIGMLFSTTVLVYIQDNVGWIIGYGLPTIGLAVSVLVFLLGTPFYRHKLPLGSPITRMLKVFVAAVRKWKACVPDNPKELHELSMEEYTCNGRNIIDHTSSLSSFLDKAAINTGQTSSWMLCTVTQVEETKQMAKMIPILIITVIPSTLVIQTPPLFIKQGTTLDRRVGPHFEIPPASLTAFVVIFMLISIIVYDRVFVPVIRLYTKNPRGITILQRLGIGLVVHVIIMVVASLVERKRLSVAKENNLLGQHDTLPLTIFILLPQFALSGVADNFTEIAKMEFFYDQAPQGMKSLRTAYSTTSLGLGGFISTYIMSTVADVTRRHGHKGWVLDNLNVSRLDYYYYAFMAVLSLLNFLCFVVVAKFFVYNVDVDVRQNNSGLEMSLTSPRETMLV